jgi:circadian clock protein KaiC
MVDSYENTLLIKRVPSGITGLDEILKGGFLEGGVYIVQGAPGTGKTILGNEVCFRHAAAGGRAAYVTLLAEMHTRMLQHLRSMAFFNEALIPEALYYISAFHTLESAGLKGLIDVLRREIKGHAASLLMLDGLVAAQESAQSDREFKKFINEIQAHAGAYDCTVLLLTSSGLHTVSAEHTMVDGVIELEDKLFGVRPERSLTVRKFRGSGFLRGRHAFRITAEGIKLFPRIEAAFARPSREDVCAGRLSSGVQGLDEMLGGGLPAGSATGVLGCSGSGKTTLGLQFMSLCTAAEPGLYFGFFENPAALARKAQTLVPAFGDAVQRGDVEMLWQPQHEHIIDELAYRLLAAVRRRNVKRLFIDGLGSLIESGTYPERTGRFLACLVNELRARGATTLLTMQTPQVLESPSSSPGLAQVGELQALLDNLVRLRLIENRSGLRRLLSIGKVRDSSHDMRVCEFAITAHGIRLAGILPPGDGKDLGTAGGEPAASPATPAGGGS